MPILSRYVISLQRWCAQRQAPTWLNRFWAIMEYIGAFAFLTGLTDAFFAGMTGLERFSDAARSYDLFLMAQGRQAA